MWQTSRTPFWATNRPAAVVAPPDKKLECWKCPFFFSPTYKILDVLRTNIHLEPSCVFKGFRLCLYISFPCSIITSNSILSLCKCKLIQFNELCNCIIRSSLELWIASTDKHTGPRYLTHCRWRSALRHFSKFTSLPSPTSNLQYLSDQIKEFLILERLLPHSKHFQILWWQIIYQ